MTDKYKNASDWLNNCTDAFFSDLSIKATLREAITLATESEQLRKERDELAALVEVQRN